MIDAIMKRNLYALLVAVLGLSFLPGVGPFLKSFIDYSIMGAFTVGAVLGVIGLFVAYELYYRRI